jgi:DNA-binding transcriptional LysR family regulator
LAIREKGKRVGVAVEGRLTVDDPDLAVKAAADGLSALYVGLPYVAGEIKTGRPVLLLEDWRPRPTGILLYWRCAKIRSLSPFGGRVGIGPPPGYIR